MPVESDQLEIHIKQLRLKIGDIGHEIDVYKNGTAAAMGGGLFLLLLATGAAYDVISGNASIRIALGVTRDQFYWIALALTVSSLALLALGIIRQQRRDYKREAKIDELESKLAELLERKKMIDEDGV